MENIRKLLGYIRDSFFQLKENIIKWFQSLRPDPETSNDEMPSMQDGPIMDLSDEILLELELELEFLLEIMSYLTKNDVDEKNVAKVSTRFQRLSEDKILIAKIKKKKEEEGRRGRCRGRGCIHYNFTCSRK